MEPVLLAISALSLVVAAGTSAYAWRLSRRERLRTEARVAALAADIRRDEFADPMREPHDHLSSELALRSSLSGGPKGPPYADVRPGLFGERQDAESRPRLLGVAAAGVLAVSAIIAVLVLTSDGNDDTRSRAAAHPLQSAPEALSTPETVRVPEAAAAEPLELIALAHERAANRLIVRGLVRSSTSSPLTAVVLLLDREGGLIGTGYADLGRPEAAASRETADRSETADLKVRPTYERRFVVSVPDCDAFGGYRVSFKRDDQVVPHVDRRS
jgi:hypothetical protein